MSKHNTTESEVLPEISQNNETPAKSEIGQLNQNLAALTEFGETVITTWHEGQELAAETERREMQLENEIHARNVKLIVAALIALVVICLVAMFFGRFETVDTIIDSVFKALAGAGIIGFLTRRKTNKE